MQGCGAFARVQLGLASVERRELLPFLQSPEKSTELLLCFVVRGMPAEHRPIELGGLFQITLGKGYPGQAAEQVRLCGGGEPAFSGDLEHLFDVRACGGKVADGLGKVRKRPVGSKVAWLQFHNLAPCGYLLFGRPAGGGEKFGSFDCQVEHGAAVYCCLGGQLEHGFELVPVFGPFRKRQKLDQQLRLLRACFHGLQTELEGACRLGQPAGIKPCKVCQPPRHRLVGRIPLGCLLQNLRKFVPVFVPFQQFGQAVHYPGIPRISLECLADEFRGAPRVT